jgi:hypothetical protein
MFDFLFGGKKKLELIRELLEQRMRNHGFDDIKSRLKVKQLSNSELLGTPEAAIVTIIETVIKMQSQGMILSQILEAIESHRSSLGHNPEQFGTIIDLARGEDAGSAVAIYTFYRINLEAPGRVTEDQFVNAFGQATQVLMQ